MPNARDHALELLKVIARGDEAAYRLAIAELEESCRLPGRKPDRLWIVHRMRAASEKWKAVYLAIRKRNGNVPPPEPFYYSGPYLQILKTLIAQKEGDTDFYVKLLLLGNHATGGASRCVLFHTLFEEQLALTPRSDLALHYTKPRLYLLNDLYQQYLYGDSSDATETSVHPPT